MATLTNTKIKDTYDGLLKTTDNEALDVSGVTLIEDGLGNASALSVGRSGNGVTITGSLNATLATAAQPNITSVGTLTSLDVGNISMSNSLPTITMTDSDLTDVYARVRASAGGFLFEADEANQQADTTIRFEIDGDEKVRIDSSGNVGIGTSSPTAPLQVERSSSGWTTYIKNTSATSPSGLLLSGGDSSANFAMYVRNAAETSDLFAIKGNGNVGIGTSSPDTAIHAAASSGVTLRLESTTTTLATGGVLGAIEFETQDSGSEGVNAKINSVFENTVGATSMQFFTSPAFSTISASPQMVINSSGNVGIGESNPTAVSSGATTLTIKGSTTTKGGALLLRSSDNSVSSYIYPDSTNGLTLGSLSNHNVRFISNSAERMRIDSSGNVGIGVVPFERLTIATAALNSAPEFLSFHDTTSGSNWANGQTYGGIRWRMTDGTGIGPHEVAEIRVDNTYTGAAGDGAIIFSTAPYNTTMSERMRITSGGDVSIGTETPIGGTMLTLQKAFAGNTAISTNTTTASTTYVPAKFLHNGTLVGFISSSTTSTAYNTTSDYRLKENVVEMTGALDRVDALKPSRFNFIADPEKTVDGFLAHEVQAIIPEAVTGEKDAVDEEGNPMYQAIDQSKIVPLLVGAIKELSAKVAALESQLNA